MNILRWCIRTQTQSIVIRSYILIKVDIHCGGAQCSFVLIRWGTMIGFHVHYQAPPRWCTIESCQSRCTYPVNPLLSSCAPLNTWIREYDNKCFLHVPYDPSKSEKCWGVTPTSHRHRSPLCTTLWVLDYVVHH